MIGGLELDGRDVVESAVKPLGVEPVHPAQRGKFDVVDAAPRALLADQLGLVQAVGRFGQRVVVAVADRPDRGDRPELGEPFAVADRGELAAGIGVAHQPLKRGPAAPRLRGWCATPMPAASSPRSATANVSPSSGRSPRSGRSATATTAMILLLLLRAV